MILHIERLKLNKQNAICKLTPYPLSSDLFFKKCLITFKVMPERQTSDKSQHSIDPVLLNTLFFKRLFVVFDKKKELLSISTTRLRRLFFRLYIIFYWQIPLKLNINSIKRTQTKLKTKIDIE